MVKEKMLKPSIHCHSGPVPVILGGYVNGLGLVRSFGKKKIPTILLDYKRSLASYSRYTKGIICPDPIQEEEEFICFLIELGKQLPHKGFLLATNDIWLIPISKNRSVLSEYYHYPMPDWDVIEKCWRKEYLYKIAKENSIPIPKTFFIKTLSELDNITLDIPFPCILKPSITIGFMEKLGSNGRTIVITSMKELTYWKQKIQHAGLTDISLILQAQIPGSPSNLYTITSYANKKSEIVAYSIGHKIRQYPPEAGTITSGEVENIPEVLEWGSRLIKALRFYGISNIEFKKDDRDGSYKLIEINPRPGMWNYSVLMSGVNLPYIAYLDCIGEKNGTILKSSEGKKWILLSQDLISAVYTNKKDGYYAYSLTLGEWIKSVRGERIYAIESWKDPLPGVFHWNNVWLAFMKKIMNSIFPS
jgi:D-aspartate ligase